MLKDALLPVALGAVLLGCPPPPTLDDPTPGAPDCGTLDPNVVLPPRLCPAQRTVVRDEGKPEFVRPRPGGGLIWVYRFASGDVFGQREGFRFYDWSPEGRLLDRREEFTQRAER